MKQTFESFPIVDVTGLGASPSLRLAADVDFQALTGEVHLAGDDQTNYRTFALDLDGTTATTDDEIVDTTDDSSNPNATYSLYLMNSQGKLVRTLFEGWAFTASWGDSVDWQRLEEFNVNRVPLRDDQAYSKRQTDLLITGLYAPDARTTVAGKGYASTNPVSGAPTFLTTNDSLVLSQGENDAAQGTSGTPSNTNRFMTASDVRVMEGYFNAKSFGALGDGVTDDTVALRAWLTDQQANGGVAYLPPGRYYANPSSGTEVLPILHPGIFMGGGDRNSIIIVGPNVPDTCDIIRVDPSVAIGTGPFNDIDSRGYHFRDFGITSHDGYDDTGAAARPGRHCLNFDVSDTDDAIYQSTVERVYFTDLGGYGVYVTPNASPGGIYAFGYSSFRDCTIYNGLALIGSVDTLLLDNVTCRGKNAIVVSQGEGSTEALIFHCNTTLPISIQNALRFKIVDTIVELRHSTATGLDGACISIHGGIIKGGKIEGCHINAVADSPLLNGIYIQSATAVEVGSNNYQLDSSKTMVVLHGTDVTNAQLSLRQIPTSGGTPPATFALNGATVIYEGVAVGDAYITGLPGRLSYAGGARFGTGTHGYSNLYAGQTTPGFGSIAAGGEATFTINVPGVTVSYETTCNPQGFNPGVGLKWDTWPATDAIVLKVVNSSASPVTPTAGNWTWYAKLANT